MDVSTDHRPYAQGIAKLFETTFANAEGPEEGALIGALAASLLKTTAAEDIVVYCLLEGDAPRACAIFTRLSFPDDPRTVFILSPMAVSPDRQGRGVGRDLIAFALSDLRSRGVEVAVVYGDPGYYGRVGFLPVSEEVLHAPLPLSLPHGWLAQSLERRGSVEFAPFRGASRCVEALTDPVYW